MEIEKEQLSDDEVEVRVRGRLDAYWADHLKDQLDQVVREGTHILWLELSEVNYVSSLGIGVFLRFHKQLRGLGGSLRIVNPSDLVREVLTASGLTSMLVAEASSHRAGTTTWKHRAPKRGKIRERDGISYETFAYSGRAPLDCRLVGDPALLDGCRFRAADCTEVSLGPNSFALGVGALGRGFEECQSRFGELLAVAGTVAYLPTDGSNVPDFFAQTATSVAKARLCYGLVLEGSYSHLSRFDAKQEASTVTLTDLVAAGFEWVGADIIGMVLIAESAGLIGVALRRSPALESTPDAPFAPSQVRDWLSFTGERAYVSSTTLVAGVAAKTDNNVLAPMLRSMGPRPFPVGHFHAAPFSHLTFPKGEIELQPTAAALFESHQLQSVIHLLGDYREAAGLGESQFVRGACWVGPVAVGRSSS